MSEARRKIHIVDDDPSVRDALTLVFELEGYDATGFGTGAEFLASARQAVPDCVLLDVHMPGKSGLDVLAELGAHQFADLRDLGPG